MKLKISATALVLLLITLGLALSNQERLRLDTSAFDDPQRIGAVFDHDRHNEKAGLDDRCALCHHVYDEKGLVKGAESTDSYCSDCHGLKPHGENGVSLEVAFHKRCKQCHFESNKGPVLCGECHVNQ